ncbi:MAG: hypothetical protein MJE66_00800 [Proteobacteria bacterium]|nr:hypothetical protein [Pseudomonadota bacterium]
MTKNPARDDLYTVIVTVDAEPEIMPRLEAHARFGLDAFAEFDGYCGGQLHVSLDRRRLVQIVRWRTEGDYLACRDDARWEEVPTTKAFMAAVESPNVVMDVRAYTVVASRV